MNNDLEKNNDDYFEKGIPSSPPVYLPKPETGVPASPPPPPVSQPPIKR